MTLERFIIKLQAFEKSVGGKTQICILHIERGKKIVLENITTAIGYDDVNNKVGCIFIGEKSTLEFLQDLKDEKEH